MDKLECMRAFVAVVDAGGFTAAANQLNAAKSAVSQRVSELEKTLSTRLLNRTTRSISLTDTGRIYYEHSVHILSDMRDMESAITDSSTEFSGRLKITAPMSFGLLHLSSAINDFMSLHPEMNLELELNDRHVNLVEEGFDLALRISKLEDSSLIARQLAPIRRVTVASPTYLASHGIPETPQDLERHNGLVYSHAPKGSYWLYRDNAGKSYSVDVPTRIRVNNGDVLCDVAIAGLGVSILPTFIVSGPIRNGDLVVLLDGYHCRQLSLYAVYPPPRYQPQRVKAFVEFLADRYGDTPYWDNGQ